MTFKQLSHIKTLSMNDGMLGFELRMKGGEYRIGDHLSFYPCIDIYQYSVSDANERFLKHVFYDLYEFTFMAIDIYGHDDDEKGEDIELCKDRYHYLIELLPGFNVFHFNWPKKIDEYLQINTIYRGFGTLSNCGNAALENPKIDPKAMKRMRCRGRLERLQINGLWRDCHDYITPKEEDTNDDDDNCLLIAYDDVLKGIGYPDDMLKFQAIISRYQDENTSFDSTRHYKDTDRLVYTIRMA